MIMDSTSSQIWAIFLPNRNFYEKLISWPPESPKVRSQNEGYISNIFSKLQENCIFRVKSLDVLRKEMCSMNFLVSKVFKAVID